MYQFFTKQALKAWVGGVLSALLTPFLTLLTGDGEITLRTVLVALISGALTAAAVYGATNAPADDPGEHAVDR